MMLGTKRYAPWTQDRFMVFLVMAAGLHLLLFFGISFGISLKPIPHLADTLDVVLVQWRSEDEPEKADYLAQASQKGGGETMEKSRPSEPVSGELPTMQEGADPQQSVQQTPAPAPELREVIAAETDNAAVLQPTAVEQPESQKPDAATLMQQSMEMASLRP